MDKVLESILLKSQYTPREMYEVLNQNGYIGQEKAKKALCLMAYRHINRLVKLYLKNIPREHLPSKENYLLLGPTGSGKTFLVELLFQKILEIPTVIVDITNFSETGYVGQDVPSILTRLIHAAGDKPFLASFGIVCLDEFDKIASGQNSAVFSGAGTTKDVTGIGVQRELLKMLESSDVDVPLSITHSTYGDRVTFNTAHVTFVACGAFSGFRQILKSKEQNIGFGKNQKFLHSGISTGLSRQEVEKAVNFEAYGLMPELIGRFARIIPFDALSREDLKRILHENTIVKYRYELMLDGIKLQVEDAVYDLIIDKSMERETGARGLKSYIVEYLEEACFEVYSSEKRSIRLFTEKDQIAWEIL
ncbi:MAG: AAA family ATPase [Microscillaceae bacterium]|nr:AAA family ATPase [Microscillaceae bacterium]